MSLHFRLLRHAIQALRRGVGPWAAAVLLGLALAACEEAPAAEPRIASPSAIEVAVMQAAEESTPTPTPAAERTAAPVRTETPAPPAPTPRPPSPTPTATPTATPTPPPEPLDDAVLERLQEAASLIERVTGSPAALQAGPDLRELLQAAALEFLARYGPDPEAAERLDYAIGSLPPLGV